MNILMLTPRFPYPPTRGDCIRAWAELEHLARRHQVWLACVDHHAPPAAHLAHVRQSCAGVAVAVRSGLTALLRGGLRLLCGGSLVEGYFAQAGLARTIRHWAEQVSFDALLVFAPEMMPYARAVPAARCVLDMNDVESFKWNVYARRAGLPWRWLYAWEARRLAIAERNWAAAPHVCLLVNERERRRLELATEPRRTAVVRTGVDLERYAAGSGATSAGPLPQEPIVGFVGSMFYPPNVRAVEWFGREVWPRVRRAVPRARWLIVGSRPTRRVRTWARQPGVTVTGFVEDIRPYFSRLRVFACGVAEEIGVQTKLIEALAAARPSVVTPAAAAGIDYQGEPPFLIAASASEFAEAVVRLLADDALAGQLSRRARLVAEQNYGAAQQYALVERWLAGDFDGQHEAGKGPLARRHRRPHQTVRCTGARPVGVSE